MAYTLYDGAGATPFIHALDTAHATARCIDLAGLAPSIVGRLRLRTTDGGHSVTVLNGPRELLRLDTTTFAVSHPHGAPSTWRVPALIGQVSLRRCWPSPSGFTGAGC